MNKNIIICEICNKKGYGKSMIVLKMDLILKKQAKEIFKEMHRILGKRVFHWNDYYAMKKRFLK